MKASWFSPNWGSFDLTSTSGNQLKIDFILVDSGVDEKITNDPSIQISGRTKFRSSIPGSLISSFKKHKRRQAALEIVSFWWKDKGKKITESTNRGGHFLSLTFEQQDSSSHSHGVYACQGVFSSWHRYQSLKSPCWDAWSEGVYSDLGFGGVSTEVGSTGQWVLKMKRGAS